MTDEVIHLLFSSNRWELELTFFSIILIDIGLGLRLKRI